MLDGLLRFLVRWRAAFVGLWLILIGVGASLLPGLKFQFALHPLLKGDSEQVKAVREFYESFPPAEGRAVVAVTWPEVITVNQLRQAAEWAKELEALPEVKKVYSPASILDLEFQGFTIDEWARLGGTGDEPVELGDSPGMGTVRGRFISKDLKSVAFHVQKERGSNRKFFEALDGTASQWDQTARVLGTEVVLMAMGDTLRSDLIRLLSLEMVALFVILPLFMRSFRRSFLPLMTSATGLLAFFAMLSAAGEPFGLMFLAGPVLITVIGLSDSIHLQQKFDDARAMGMGVVESLREMLRSVGMACVLTSLTTCIGFLSLLFARHEEVRKFGLWCAVGVVLAFVVAMLFMPVALSLFPGTGKLAPMRNWVNPDPMRRFALPVALILVTISLGFVRVEIDSSLSRELPASAESVQNLAWFAEHFHGNDRVELEINGLLDDRDAFTALENLQSELSKVEGVTGASSYVDMIHFLLAPEIVETKDGPYLGLRALGDIKPFPSNLLDRDGDRAAMTFYIAKGFGSHQFQKFSARLDELNTGLPPQLDVKLNGYVPMAYQSVNLITETLLRSFVASLVAITIVLAIALRSPLLALLCLIPNALPILVAAGVWGWLDFPLRLGVVIVFSIGLGLAVDDTIHLVVRFRQLRAEGKRSLREDLDEAVRSAGLAIVLTSVTLLIAASAFLISSFTTLRDTGFLLGAITITALLADLMVLPWLIEHTSRLPWVRHRFKPNTDS